MFECFFAEYTQSAAFARGGYEGDFGENQVRTGQNICTLEGSAGSKVMMLSSSSSLVWQQIPLNRLNFRGGRNALFLLYTLDQP